MTIASEIARRYLSLQQSITAELGSGIFPELGTVDPTDIVVMISQFFSSSYKQDYRPTIIMLTRLKGINVDTTKLDQVYPDIASFLDWTIETIRNRT